MGQSAKRATGTCCCIWLTSSLTWASDLEAVSLAIDPAPTQQSAQSQQ